MFADAHISRLLYLWFYVPSMILLNILLYAHISKASNLLSIFQIYLTRVT